MLKLFLQRTSRSSLKVSVLAIVVLQNKTAELESQGIYGPHKCE